MIFSRIKKKNVHQFFSKMSKQMKTKQKWESFPVYEQGLTGDLSHRGLIKCQNGLIVNFQKGCVLMCINVCVCVCVCVCVYVCLCVCVHVITWVHAFMDNKYFTPYFISYIIYLHLQQISELIRP